MTPLEWVVIGTTVASFLLNAYRSNGPDPTGTVVFQNRRMLKELHGRFDTYGAALKEIARGVINIPVEVRRDVNQALNLYRLREVNGLRTRIADCAELVKNGEKCDYNLDQLWTDYVAQTAAFFNHGGLTAIALPELYEFERWYLYVTGKDSALRLRQLNDHYEAAVRKALTVGELPKGMPERSIKLKKAYEEAMKKYRALDDSNCGDVRDLCFSESVVDEQDTRDKWNSRTNDFAFATRAYESQAQWYSIYKEVAAALLVFSERRLSVDLGPYISWQWPTDYRWTETLDRLLSGSYRRTPTKQCECSYEWHMRSLERDMEEQLRRRGCHDFRRSSHPMCQPELFTCDDWGRCESIHW